MGECRGQFPVNLVEGVERLSGWKGFGENQHSIVFYNFDGRDANYLGREQTKLLIVESRRARCSVVKKTLVQTVAAVSAFRIVEEGAKTANPTRRIGSVSLTAKGLAMPMKLAEVQLWQRNLASLIRSGLFQKADTGEINGLHTVVGIYSDGTSSAPLAKYADLRRAQDAAALTNNLADLGRSVEAN
jgi:hypothetical protein